MNDGNSFGYSGEIQNVITDRDATLALLGSGLIYRRQILN